MYQKQVNCINIVKVFYSYKPTFKSRIEVKGFEAMNSRNINYVFLQVLEHFFTIFLKHSYFVNILSLPPTTEQVFSTRTGIPIFTACFYPIQAIVLAIAPHSILISANYSGVSLNNPRFHGNQYNTASFRDNDLLRHSFRMT